MFEYQAVAINVVDGDTLDVTTILIDETRDLGLRIIDYHRVTFEQRIRLYGIDTPERGKPGAAEATAMLKDLVMGKPLTIHTVKPADKYGRWLASLSTPDCPDVAAAIIAAGLGVAYFGGPKAPTPTP